MRTRGAHLPLHAPPTSGAGEGTRGRHCRISASRLEDAFLRSAGVMSLPKLTAGDGYTYLTR